MEDERLIEAVRCYPCLWQVGLKSYKDQRAKENAWKDVVSKLEGEWTREEMIKRWKVLRDKFVRELKKSKKGKSGDAGPPPTSCWPLFDAMGFISDTVRHKRTTTNFVQPSSPGPSAETPSSNRVSVSENEESISESTGLDEDEVLSDETDLQESSTKTPNKESKRKPKRKAEVDEVEKCLLERLNDLKKQKQSDEADLVGKRIAARLRTFDPRTFAETSLKLEHVLFEAQYPSPAPPEEPTHGSFSSQPGSGFYNYYD